ncbi:hypothetical protein CSC2_21820 [Clostridium zeae]|uniref:Uncharacterized protein n=1 Tax=Clostridium zeae TaxID=2759022 RepID=A0ABQ1EAF8_9CLOT|nr:hypothetical protein CSC2_21820 [Clostridium zeae]
MVQEILLALLVLEDLQMALLRLSVLLALFVPVVLFFRELLDILSVQEDLVAL